MMNRTSPELHLVQKVFSTKGMAFFLRSPKGGDRLKQRFNSLKPFFLVLFYGIYNSTYK